MNAKKVFPPLLVSIFVLLPTVKAHAQVADLTPPLLTITSHTDGQTVGTPSITLSGTATDNGRGNSGIISVTVNGDRASTDTAVGSGIANWTLTVVLSYGPNTITVIATDASTA